jgi:hypothetical protein
MSSIRSLQQNEFLSAATAAQNELDGLHKGGRNKAQNQ